VETGRSGQSAPIEPSVSPGVSSLTLCNQSVIYLFSSWSRADFHISYIANIYRFPYRPSTSEGEKSGSSAQAGDADVEQKESKSLVFRLYDDWGAGVSLLNFIAGNETETEVEPSNASNETTRGKEGDLQVESGSDKADVDVGKQMDDDDLDLEDDDDLPESERAEKTSSQPSERKSEEKKVKPHPYLVTR
jgi:hypothetical protein